MQISINIQTHEIMITCNQCGHTAKVDGAALLRAASLKSAALAAMGAHWLEKELCPHMSAAFDMATMRFTVKG